MGTIIVFVLFGIAFAYLYDIDKNTKALEHELSDARSELADIRIEQRHIRADQEDILKRTEKE